MLDTRNPYSRWTNWIFTAGFILICMYACKPHHSFESAPVKGIYSVYDVTVTSRDGRKTAGPYKVALVGSLSIVPQKKQGVTITDSPDLTVNIVNTCAGEERDDKQAAQYWCIVANGELCANNARLAALQPGESLTEGIESYCELKTLQPLPFVKGPAVTVKPVKIVTGETQGTANATYTLLKSCDAEIVEAKRWVVDGSKNNGVISLPTYVSGKQYDLVKPPCFAPEDLALMPPPP